jgi:hypothetical protein
MKRLPLFMIGLGLWVMIGPGFCAELFAAENTIPAGTTLPVMLSSTLDVRKSRPGQRIVARVMQDVPLRGDAIIPEGAKLVGQLIDVKQGSGGSSIKFRFHHLHSRHQQIPISAYLRAVASMMDVHDAQLPKVGTDRGTSSDAWITQQVGGDMVYRGGGPVTEGKDVVGKPVLGGGVLARLTTPTGSKCTESPEDSNRMHALWIFSSSACGAYGFSQVTISHAGRTDPVGEITLSSPKSNLKVRSGSGMLLRVNEIVQ